MRSKCSRFTLGVGVELCSSDVAQPFAAARNSFISRGRRGTLWHINTFHDVWKVVLWGRHNISCEVFRRCVAFYRRRSSTLETSDVILRVRRSTLDVSCCVFSANRIVSAARSGDKVQIPWQAWHFVTCDENGRKPSQKTSILRSVREKTRRKTSILKLRSVKCQDVLREMLVLMVQHVSSRVAGFCGAIAVSMGDAAKPFLVEGFKTGCNVVLRGKRGTSWHSSMFHDASKVVLCGRRNTFATYSEDALHFSSQAQHFRPVVLRFFANRIVKAARSGDPHNSTLYICTLHTLHSTLYNLNSRLHTPHFTLHTFNFTLNTPHCPF